MMKLGPDVLRVFTAYVAGDHLALEAFCDYHALLDRKPPGLQTRLNVSPIRPPWPAGGGRAGRAGRASGGSVSLRPDNREVR